MNGFLVILCHTKEDVPISLHRTYSQALVAAAKIKPMPTQQIRKVYDTDCSTPVAVRIVQFTDGKAVKCTVVSEFD